MTYTLQAMQYNKLGNSRRYRLLRNVRIYKLEDLLRPWRNKTHIFSWAFGYLSMALAHNGTLYLRLSDKRVTEMGRVSYM